MASLGYTPPGHIPGWQKRRGRGEGVGRHYTRVTCHNHGQASSSVPVTMASSYTCAMTCIELCE